MHESTESTGTHYWPLLHTVSQTVAFPHGYTLLIWGTTMITATRLGLPGALDVFCMLVGACLAYVAVGNVAKKGAGRFGPGQRRLITQPFVAASANILTLVAATGACALMSLIPSAPLAWLAVGVTGTTVYMFGITLQAFVISRKLDDQPSEDH